MGCYDIFELPEQVGEAKNVQIKTFQDEDIRVFSIGQRIPEAINDLENCNIATPEGFIIEIRDGIYTDVKEVDPNLFILSEGKEIFGYTYKPDLCELKDFLRKHYGEDYLKISMYTKYGFALF